MPSWYSGMRATGRWTHAGRAKHTALRLNGKRGGKLDYQGPLFSARLDPDTFELERVEAAAGARNGDTLSLEPCAAMYVLLNGTQAVPALPACRAARRPCRQGAELPTRDTSVLPVGGAKV